MRITTRDNHIEILRVEQNRADHNATYKVSISIEVDGFSGASDNIYIEVQELEVFKKSIKELYSTCKGEVVLYGGNPNSFYLIIRQTDTLGHFEVEFLLSDKASTLAGKFKLDQTHIHQLIGGLNEFN